MTGLEWLVAIGMLFTALMWWLSYIRRSKRLLQLYFVFDELLLPYYQESLRHHLKVRNYGEALNDIRKSLTAYKTQLAITKTHYFRKFIRHSNAFKQTYQDDLGKHAFDLETRLLLQQEKALSLIKHCRLWLMELERANKLTLDPLMKWKAPAPDEDNWQGLIHINPEEHVLFIKMQLLHTQCLQVLWCWHFCLHQNEDIKKAAQFLESIMGSHYACAKMLNLKQLLPKHDTNYEYLVQYCKEHPISQKDICSGTDSSFDPSWINFDGLLSWNDEDALWEQSSGKSSTFSVIHPLDREKSDFWEQDDICLLKAEDLASAEQARNTPALKPFLDIPAFANFHEFSNQAEFGEGMHTNMVNPRLEPSFSNKVDTLDVSLDSSLDSKLETKLHINFQEQLDSKL